MTSIKLFGTTGRASSLKRQKYSYVQYYVIVQATINQLMNTVFVFI